MLENITTKKGLPSSLGGLLIDAIRFNPLFLLIEQRCTRKTDNIVAQFKAKSDTRNQSVYL